jgi:glycosyltransferase involved in cell wall biosynthesis
MTYCFVFSHGPWLLPPALEMIDVLRDNDHTVKIIYSTQPHVAPADGDYDFNLTYEALEFKNWFQRLTKAKLLFRSIKRVLNDYRVDVLIACDIIALEAVAATHANGLKKGYWSFEFPIYESILSFDFVRCRRLASRMKNMHFLLAPSESRARFIIDRFNVKARFEVIYNCRRLKNWRDGLMLDVDLSDIDIKRFKYKIFYGGRISPAHYIDQIVEAVAFVPDSVLFLAGPGDPDYIESIGTRIMSDARIADRVRYIGRVNRKQVYSFIELADIGFVLYDHLDSIHSNDPAPNKIGDNIAGSCWMVGTSQGYIAHWLEQKGCGVCIENVTKESIAEAMSSLINRPDFLQKIKLQQVYQEEMNMEVQYSKLSSLIDAL